MRWRGYSMMNYQRTITLFSNMSYNSWQRWVIFKRFLISNWYWMCDCIYLPLIYYCIYSFVVFIYILWPIFDFYLYSAGGVAPKHEQDDLSKPSDRIWPQPDVVQEPGVTDVHGICECMRPAPHCPLRGLVHQVAHYASLPARLHILIINPTHPLIHCPGC